MKAKKEMEMRADTCKAHQAKIIYELQRFESWKLFSNEFKIRDLCKKKWSNMNKELWYFRLFTNENA
jgi:hypothetical protein